MITYELAKDLKDAGFPFKEKHAVEIDGQLYKAFTLSELIGACGEEFLGLTKLNDDDPDKAEGGWYADTRTEGCNCDYESDPHFNWKSEFGKTPEEAVAKLWLALNNEKA